jgi:hypothetical protein
MGMGERIQEVDILALQVSGIISVKNWGALANVGEYWFIPNRKGL